MIQYFVENLEKETQEEVFIHSYNGITYFIPYPEILCVFVRNRRLTLISIYENIELANLTFSQFAEKVAKPPYHFLKIGRNYLINPKTIRKIDADKGIVSLFLHQKSYQISLEASEIGRIKKELQQG